MGYQTGGFGGGVSDDVGELDDVFVVLDGEEDLDFPLDFPLLDGLEYFDDDSVVVGAVDALEDVGVLAPADLADDLVLVGVARRREWRVDVRTPIRCRSCRSPSTPWAGSC